METTKVAIEQITSLLNKWHDSIRNQNTVLALEIRNDVKEKIDNIEGNQNILFYYSLLEFRYQLLINDFRESKILSEKINSFEKPADNFLSYYYYFFNAIHATEIGKFKEANVYFNNAKELLKNIPDEAEKAEFSYKFAAFNYQIRQPLVAINYATKAKKYYENSLGNEINIAGCTNILGLTCTSLGQYEAAEEYFINALDIVNKKKNTQLALKIRHNLGFLYAEQNLSEAAIRNLSASIEDPETDYKCTFLLAREHFKLGHTKETNKLIEKGLEICNRLQAIEYKHHFSIIHALNTKLPTSTFEIIIKEGIQYFEQEDLLGFVHDYSKQLALKFYASNQSDKASQYFYKSHEAEQKLQDKEALK
ncbi:Rap family tetratricopeptide repeat protein [Bacillus sp. BP-3]|uniref:Rap family tetratricopeptide repeat protein n=1 Tax=Bacillus sp. BP-3 TaxID=3022773 RepID=UPI00232C106D|nr:Rap family tetratricopeptide repeat protein [Bacillus sp. BP-3]MDC2864127.1 tetratricopeptide repeat protein [Bacillus sp. BP-3]